MLLRKLKWITKLMASQARQYDVSTETKQRVMNIMNAIIGKSIPIHYRHLQS